MEAFLPLLSLVVLYLVFALVSKGARKVSQAQKKTFPAPATPAAAPGGPPPQDPAEPRVREIRPTVSVHEHDDSVYRGSLNAVTGEGYDPCHEEQMSGMEKVCKPGAEAPAAFTGETAGGLPLGWTGNDVVRGIVMSEILNRKRR